MKKILTILGLAGVVGVGSFAFASDNIVENKSYDDNSKYEQRMDNRHRGMMDYNKDELNKAIENGEISQEEAEKWEEHYNYMDEFHKENGFSGCHGRSRSGMRRGHRN